MDETEKPPSGQLLPLAPSLSLAVVSGIGMFFTALGMMFLFENFLRYSTFVLPFSTTVLAIIFVVSFAIITALLELRGAGHLRSLGNGFMLGAIVTVLVVLVSGGILFIMGVGGPYSFSPALWELLVAAVACIAAGFVVMRLLPRQSPRRL